MRLIKKSIMTKYVLINVFILIFSFTFLSFMLWSSISNYWKQEKHQLLTQNAKIVANIVEEKIFEQDGELYVYNPTVMKAFLSTFSSNINADIFITDNEGKEIFSSNITVSQEILEKTTTGIYSQTSTLDGIYSNDHYIVGISVKDLNQSFQNEIGFVFLAADTQNLYSFRMDIIYIFLLSAAISFALSLLAIFLFSYKMTAPLKQMSIASQQFGNGDFSERILVKSEDEIGQLAISLNEMADSLSKSEKIRRNFVANVSHELKTPMTSIAGFVDGILDGTVEREKQMHYLQIVSTEIKRLSRLVASMLGLSKIDSDSLTLNIQSFDISNVILDTLISFEKSIESKGVEVKGLDLLKNTFISGDLDMIYQVIYNVTENAVKFVNTNGYIHISMFEEKKQVIIRIKNSGPGINSEDLKMIFDRFYKTDKSRSQDKNGLGLGLFIVKTIINLHKGMITASSELNEYTQIEICLPK